MESFKVYSGTLADIRWTLLSIVGEEAVSELFKFVIQIEAPRAELSAALDASDDAAGHYEHHLEAYDRALIGQRVLFRFRWDGPPRFGFVSSARVEATNDLGGEPWTRLSLEVVPRAWLLTQRRNSRIFQGLYVHQIVSLVLTESGVSHRWDLTREYPKRVFCTQYDETDWDFVTRLLAEEGILFFFEHALKFEGGKTPEFPGEKDTWVDDLGTASQIIGGVSNVVGAVAGDGGSKAMDWVALGAKIGNVTADAIKPIPKDEEADDPFVPQAGCAGPPGWAMLPADVTSGPRNAVDPEMGTDVLAFVDHAAYVSTPAVGEDEEGEIHLSLHEAGGIEGGEESLTELWPVRRIRAKATTVRDFDFRRPMLLLEDNAEEKKAVVVPGEAALSVYAHHGEYEKPDLFKDVAEVQLAQHRADVATLSGRGHCSRMSAGGTFTLANAKAALLDKDRYAVVRVRHELFAPRESGGHRGEDHRFDALARGCARAIYEALHRRELIAEEAIGAIIQQEISRESSLRPRRTYRNSFECVSAKHAHRPPRPPPLVRNAFESAVVVGPRGLPPPAPGPADPNDPKSGDAAKEIYTDKYGRVKIQFHWDRDGTLDEHSSCWVRVAQTWAGAGFGFQFIPRVGMEVLVGFLRGDPDRPVILGSVYNATHATPEPVPQRSTRSGIRTQTSPGGGGFNELSFEDARGVERVYVHAQKDFEETVNDTHTLNVKNNQKVTISNRQETEVGGDRLTAVGGNAATIVGGSDSTHVRGDRVVNVRCNETLVVSGNATRSVDGVSVESVKADLLTVVDGERNVTVRGSSITQIGGKDPDTKVAEVTYVQGRSIHTASDGTLIRVERPTTSAPVAIRLECGDSFIEVGPQKITLSSPTVEVHGSDKVKMASKDSHLALDRDSALLQSKSAGLATPDGSKMLVDGKHATTTAPGQATTKASKIDFRRGDGDVKKDEQKKDPPAEGPSLKLKFLHGKDGSAPIGNAKYRVIVDDLVFEGTTSASGELDAKVPETAKVAFVTLWANLVKPEIYPTGPLQWLVHILPELGAATSTRGLRVRLRNLGYEPATKLDPSDIDDVTRGALLEFQLDRDLVATGVLDDDTKTRLTTTYGS